MSYHKKLKDYKLHQILYHRLNKIEDLIDHIPYQVQSLSGSNLEEKIYNYFTDDHWSIVYPAKSYAVAIIYAKLIEKYFSEDFYSLLSDPELFLGTDKYFVTYQDDCETYDNVLARLKKEKLMDFEANKKSQVKASVNYFYSEFNLSLD
ncbi:MAG: hypothetical protein CME65_02375 [Halobacteriovoraceae bacterium]|nr:hypothetical protein [Halobacteriovoraceae bacterium]|tara:strand:+ start:13018 stop:13464 length:447 start_codon:yes stop_codon:yes gene_type:complete